MYIYTHTNIHTNTNIHTYIHTIDNNLRVKLDSEISLIKKYFLLSLRNFKLILIKHIYILLNEY